MTIKDYYIRFNEELSDLRDEILRKTDDKIASPTNEYLCTYYLLEHLKTLHHTEDYDCFQGGSAKFWDAQGRNLGEVHGYMLVKNPNEEESFQLQLYYVAYNSIEGLSDGEIPVLLQEEFNKAVDRVTGFYEKARVKGKEVPEYSAHHYISDWIYRNENKISQIVINIISNNIIKSQSVIKKQLQGSRGKTVILNENNIYDINHLYRIFCENSGRDAINVEFQKDELPCVISKRENTGYESILAVLPGTIVYDLYDTYQNELLENNVRLFLGVKEGRKITTNTKRKKKVNDEIRETLMERPQMFLAYNNGLAVTCSNVEVETSDGKLGYIRRIEDFQIVNGGQTTVSIYLAKKANPSLDLSSVFVQMKLTKVEDQTKLADEVTNISVCSNRQNEVKFTDFSANNAFYRDLENLINKDYKVDPVDGIQKRWYFDRKTNSYAQELAHSTMKSEFKIKSPKERVFKKEIMAQAHLAWLKQPYYCSSSYASCFAEYVTQIEKNNTIPDKNYAQDTIALLILYTEIANSPKNKGNRKGLLTLFSLALLHENYPQFSLFKIYTMQHVPNDLFEQLLICSNAIRIYLRDVLNTDDIRNRMKSKEDYDNIKKHIKFTFDDNIISKYLKDKSEDKNRAKTPTIILPTIDNHELVVSFGRKFWSYMRDNKGLDKISPSIADSICSKILNKQIISDDEVNAALQVCKYYSDHKEEHNYINSVMEFEKVNDGEPYDSINIAYLIMEEDDVSWDVKIQMMKQLNIDIKNMEKTRTKLINGQYNIEYENLLAIKKGLERCKSVNRI